MLIIFDLDDTLIDTSGCVTYYKLAGALEAMVQAGLKLPDLAQGLERLCSLNSKALSSKEALEGWIAELGAERSFFEIGMHAIYHSDLSEEYPLLPLEGAHELLAALKEKHRLALVTVGSHAIQMQKLKKAGIDTCVFSNILITQEVDKKPLYQALVSQWGVLGSEVLVCGDRIARDLTPGRELGFKTVLMKWGRGLLAELPHKDVDYSISSLSELRGLL